MVRWLCSIAWALSPLWGYAQEEPVIIRGDHRETVYRAHAGQHRTWHPTEASRFDPSAHFHNLPAAQTEQTGTQTLGFSAPRIRGQDSRFCEVWFDDFLLVDPPLAYPLLIGLDIKPFGELTLYEGATPMALPSTSQLGSIAFTSRPFFTSSAQFGSAYGTPFGHSLWTLQQYAPSTKTELQIRASLYGRTHETKGRYSYYSDNGTPYNPEDDYITWRDNNDARSWLLFPSVSLEQGRHTGTVHSLLYGGQGGIPGPGDVESSLRQSWKGSLYAATYRYTPARIHFPFVPSELSTHLLVRQDGKSTQGQYQSFQQSAETTTALHQTAIQANWDNPTGWHFLSHVRYGRMQLATQSLGATPQALKRESWIGYQGISIAVWTQSALELKTQLRAHRDTPDVDTSWRHAPASQVTASHTHQAWTAYITHGQSQRLPSLLESFGDGGAFAGNEALQPEAIQHRELGVRWQKFGDTLSSAYFEDQIRDKIVFVPAYAGSKAVNLEHTRIRGLEGNLDMRCNKLGLLSGVAYLEPLAFMETQTRKIPSIPAWTWTGEITYQWGPLTPRWHSRYQSVIYRDPDNAIGGPEMWIHDISLDGTAGTAFHWGICLNNLLNTQRGAIYSTTEPRQKGYTAYSEQNGYPLPGRHATIYVEAQL